MYRCSKCGHKSRTFAAMAKAAFLIASYPVAQAFSTRVTGMYWSWRVEESSRPVMVMLPSVRKPPRVVPSQAAWMSLISSLASPSAS